MPQSQPVEHLPVEELRARLRAAADEHQPDPDAMLARIVQQQTADSGAIADARPFQFLRIRPATAALGMVIVLMLSLAGTWYGVNQVIGPEPNDSVVQLPAASKRSPTEPASDAPEPPPSASPSASVASPSPSTASPSAPSPTQPKEPRSGTMRSTPLPIEKIPAGSAPERSFLWSDGSIDPNSSRHWAQSNVTLKNRSKITALDVTIRVTLTDGVQPTGSWSSAPNDRIVISVREQSGALYYRFRLRSGQTLSPGTYVFAGQYNHAAGDRDTDDDAYLATVSAGSTDVAVHGTFATR
jgi:hypothetical protein